MSVPDRIRFGYFRARYLLGNEGLVESLGKSVKQIQRYVEGDDFPFGFVQSLAEATGIPVAWFVGGETADRSLPAPHWANGITVPRYDIRASAGAGALVVSENIDEYFAVGRDWLRRNLPPWAPPNAVVGMLEGMGDSMEPTIMDGDLIMVVQDVEWRVVERGGIFVFSLDVDRLLLKRLQVLNNGDLKIISDNKAYEPDLVPFDDIPNRVRVHGQVFFAGGKPRMR
ncbi:S24 family peptidase [Mesorhizobium sp. 1M-11]|uniref:S24 family peptidase n=1 Tax=Mesorhizobium sp. 1M-11 TaxID=1529006 RepID=UPI0006C75901|nr:S24 family peptidase [Mesorhizobium sp. 1M-11]